MKRKDLGRRRDRISSHPEESPSWRESATVLCVLAVLFALLSWTRLLSRPFDQDELQTYILVADPEAGHAFTALRNGVEYNPPGLFILLRAFSWATGATDEVSFRSFAALCVLGALALLYFTLRQDVPPWPAACGVLVVGLNPILMENTVQARFYSPWMLILLGICYGLRRTLQAGQCGSGRVVALGVASAVLCSIHYFAVLSLCLLLAGFFFSSRDLRGSRWLMMVMLTAGGSTLLACWPLLKSQREALTVPTWMATPSLPTMALFLTALTLIPVAYVALFWVLGRMFHGQDASVREWGRTVQQVVGFQLPIISLAAMPGVLIVVSWVLQPVLAPRYSLPAVLAAAPLVSALAKRMGRRTLKIVALALFTLLALCWVQYGITARTARRLLQTKILELEQLPGTVPIVVESREEFMQLFHYSSGLRERLALLDFEVGEIQFHGRMGVFLDSTLVPVVERDVARRVEQYYPRYRLLKYSELHEFAALLLLRWSEDGDMNMDYPWFQSRRVRQATYELTRIETADARRDGAK